jgi:methanethiol S-methyltransferase
MTGLSYIYLSFGWIAFCFVHSLFAGLRVKKIITQRLGKYSRYYRLIYSLGSLIFLGLLLKYQAEKKETFLFSESLVIRTISFILILCGLIVMGISALRYFIPVTGLSIFTKQKKGDILFDRGIHGVIRHPLYAGTLLFIWGLFLFFPFTSNLIVSLIISAYTFIGIKLEEEKLRLQFGNAYSLYRSRVPMIIPKFGLRKSKRQIVDFVKADNMSA